MPMPRDYLRLDEEQFAKLVELLTPGYELAKAYMAEMKGRQEEQAHYDASREDRERSEADDAKKTGMEPKEGADQEDDGE